MDIGFRQQQRGPLFLAVSALVVFGLGLVFVTWQNLRQQRQFIDQHVLLSARTMLRGVQTNLLRGERRFGLVAPDIFQARAKEFFGELVASGEVDYLAAYDKSGRLFLFAGNVRQIPSDGLALPASAQLSIKDNGEWFGSIRSGKTELLAYAERAREGMAYLRPSRSGALPSFQEAITLLVGLNKAEHYALYNTFKRNAILQTGYVLIVAFTLLALLLAYFRRREQSGRVVRLEAFRSKLLDALPDGLITLDEYGIVKAANPAAKAIFGRLPDVEGENVVGAAFDALTRDFDHVDENSSASSSGLLWRQLDREGLSLELLTVPLTDAFSKDIPTRDRDAALVILRDRTRIRSLEEALRETQKLAAIGRLAAGVAHEIRNPLSSLRGFAQFFASKLKGKDPEEKYAQTMVSEADRLNRVVTDLLFLSRPRAIDATVVNLPDLVTHICELVSLDYNHDTITVGTALQIESVYADPDALKQVLLNLIMNSLSALKKTGGSVIVAANQEEDCVRISIIDDGPGMNPEEREKVFEPFYTTKKSGSGLGLAIVHKIIREHKGRVSIESIAGKGTRVDVLLPDVPAASDLKQDDEKRS